MAMVMAMVMGMTMLNTKAPLFTSMQKIRGIAHYHRFRPRGLNEKRKRLSKLEILKDYLEGLLIFCSIVFKFILGMCLTLFIGIYSFYLMTIALDKGREYCKKEIERPFLYWLCNGKHKGQIIDRAKTK